MNVEHRTTRPR